MQLLNHEAKQAVFALDQWRAGGGADPGIGCMNVRHADRALAANVRACGGRRLRAPARFR